MSVTILKASSSLAARLADIAMHNILNTRQQARHRGLASVVLAWKVQLQAADALSYIGTGGLGLHLESQPTSIRGSAITVPDDATLLCITKEQPSNVGCLCYGDHGHMQQLPFSLADLLTSLKDLATQVRSQALSQRSRSLYCQMLRRSLACSSLAARSCIKRCSLL